MFWKVGLLILFIWVIVGTWIFEAPMGGVQNPDVYRIFYFHVPVALVTFLAYALAMFQGIMYLIKRDLKYDNRSSTAAILGTIFCILATISGSIFAKQTWGMYWNWDPRETSIIVLLLVYLAYFSLRSAVDDAVKKANLSAVYSILGFIAAIFTIFIWPRIVPGLHPAAPGGSSSGTFIVMSGETWMVFGPSMLAFIGLYLWLYSLSMRIAKLQRGSGNV
ncbi:MAG: cytochrome c biogenesis protein CcsA [candidate division Zixibacteria bacterium]|nr:cytochrome c biogenesis protein CcsA [candidate division Zixibacteria bacterium]